MALLWVAVLGLLTLGQAVPFPVAHILPIVAAALGAGVHPDVLPRRDDPLLGGIGITIRTIFAAGTALPLLVDGVHTWWGGAVGHQAAGDAIDVTGALLTLRGLEVFAQLVDLSSVLTANLLAAGAAVGGVVTDMHAGGWQGGALCPGTGWPLCGTLTLCAMV